MKNLRESIAILFVGFLSVAVVFFIVQYNLIDEDIVLDETIGVSPPNQVTKTSNYLDSLEGYGDDTDVKVDATKEDNTNTVVVKSESNKDMLGEVIDDKSKSSYMQNLEEYADKVDSENLDESKAVLDNLREPERLPQEEVVDEIGMAIDAALDEI